MTRFATLALFGASALSLTTSLIHADGPTKAIQEKLAMQKAIFAAKNYLARGEAALAVEELEKHLDIIDGNQRYLRLLRQAYIPYITTLRLNGKQREAQIYLNRLKILDPMTAKQMLTNPEAGVSTSHSQETAVDPGPKLLPTPTPKRLPASKPKATTDPTPMFVVTPKPATKFHLPRLHSEPKARGQMPVETTNPFATKNALPPTAEEKRKKQTARRYLLMAEEMFRRERYVEARNYFEWAYRTDKSVTKKCRDQWAYCKLSYVVTAVQKGLKEVTHDQLKEEVRIAMSMTSNKGIQQNGKQLLTKLQSLKNNPRISVDPVRGGKGRSQQAIRVKHLHSDQDGWDVAETPHFRIYHHGQKREFVEQVGQIAEATRSTTLRKWFDSAQENWATNCAIYLHANGTLYSQRTKAPAHSPGHSRIETNSRTGTIASRQIHLRCDNYDLLPAILPHETTHVCVAGQFGRHPVPRWVDEGIAVLSEPSRKQAVHKQNLQRFGSAGQLIPFKELMELPDYPDGDRINVFYAQSVSVVEYLTTQKTPQVFTRFVKDGLEYGFDKALQRHYGHATYRALQARWEQSVFPNGDRGDGYASRK